MLVRLADQIFINPEHVVFVGPDKHNENACLVFTVNHSRPFTVPLTAGEVHVLIVGAHNTAKMSGAEDES